MAAGWSTEETKALVRIWGDADIQSLLDGVSRNRIVYEKIAKALTDLGWDRTWQQCKTKIKNLTQKYRKVRDSNVSGNSTTTCPLYDEIDAILGNRAASQPTTLLDSGQSHTQADIDVDLDTTVLETSAAVSPTQQQPLDSTQSQSSTCCSASQQRNDISDRKRGQKRKRSEDEPTVQLLQIFEQIEEKQAEREARYRERELELEAKAREREDRREERMMTMLSAIMQAQSQQHIPFSGNSPYPQSEQLAYSQHFPLFSAHTSPACPQQDPQNPSHDLG